MINADKPHLWKPDVAKSVALFNEWFLRAAPEAYRDARAGAIGSVAAAFTATTNLEHLTPAIIKANPKILPVLRMCTAPPIARDRLTGLSQTPPVVVARLEAGLLPTRLSTAALDSALAALVSTVTELLDPDLFPWLSSGAAPTPEEKTIALTVVGDRLSGTVADPVIRNAQEERQLQLLESWLLARRYTKTQPSAGQPITSMKPGTFWFRVGIRATDGDLEVNIPIDCVVQPHQPIPSRVPVLIEAKSAGDFTNTNKRRKEEATKNRQLRATFGKEVTLLLFLCGYFDTPYLGYEAAEGLDWVWEHRIDDLAAAGV